MLANINHFCKVGIRLKQSGLDAAPAIRAYLPQAVWAENNNFHGAIRAASLWPLALFFAGLKIHADEVRRLEVTWTSMAVVE